MGHRPLRPLPPAAVAPAAFACAVRAALVLPALAFAASGCATWDGRSAPAAGGLVPTFTAAPAPDGADESFHPGAVAAAALLTPGPELVNPLIAMVDAYFGDGSAEEGPGKLGAAIVAGSDSDAVYLATANHVVAAGYEQRLDRVEVRFAFLRDERLAAAVVAQDSDLDLAVLRVRTTDALSRGLDSVPFARTRSAHALQPGAGLYTIGNPNANPWYATPFEPDRFRALQDGEITFDTRFVTTGHSGGGLFTEDWYLVGMIRVDAPPLARAVPIDRIVARLREWSLPVALDIPRLPPPPPEPFRDCPTCPLMVGVPPGEFEMGAGAGEVGRYSNEAPRRRVTISRPLAVGKYEVTAAEFAAFIEATGYDPGPGCTVWYKNKQGWEEDRDKDWRHPGFPLEDPRRPVVCVDWHDAEAYVEWLARRTERPYRLLTEAEWEYAARSWTDTRYWWGDHLPANMGVCAECGSPWDRDRTAPVGQFPPNHFGLHDMHGNVWEWVEDCWHDDYSGDPPPDGRAWTAGCVDDSRRILRGGSWVSSPDTLRSANRLRESADERRNSAGFRVTRPMD